MSNSSFFQGLYLELYRDHLIEDEQTESELGLLREIFGDAPRHGLMLDLACGHGRHAIPLALEGWNVAALDNQQRFLDAARAEAERQGASVEWILGDMRRLPFENGSLAGAWCLFNSWGYLGADEAADEAAQGKRSRPVPRLEDPNFHVLAEVARALEPGARLLLDLPNRPELIRLIRQHPRTRMIGSGFDIEEAFGYIPEAGVLSNETIFKLGRKRQETGYRLRLYSPGEVERYLRAAGFEPEGWLGSLDGEEFYRGSSRMIVWARKAG